MAIALRWPIYIEPRAQLPVVADKNSPIVSPLFVSSRWQKQQKKHGEHGRTDRTSSSSRNRGKRYEQEEMRL
ncbi:hypothetical protein MUK42_32807 [Musa troglodytarum]|uniref:Uncharacterized protein n=1 Tax=Musa troglodytarum TaxID=320322 RepID=A0A9E7JSC4_9LILI|nr:hypothetical protein MUK42_32807 [Musa troglodytarum]